jgi:hypothetical protein
MVLVTHLHMVV